MRRLFYIALGATAGVLVVRRITQTANKFTPEGMAQSMGGVGARLSAFMDEVRVGMAEREADLRDALGLDGERDLDPHTAATIVNQPFGMREH